MWVGFKGWAGLKGCGKGLNLWVGFNGGGRGLEMGVVGLWVGLSGWEELRGGGWGLRGVGGVTGIGVWGRGLMDGRGLRDVGRAYICGWDLTNVGGA